MKCKYCNTDMLDSNDDSFKIDWYECPNCLSTVEISVGATFWTVPKKMKNVVDNLTHEWEQLGETEVMPRRKDARDSDVLFDWEKEPCDNCGKYKTYEGHDGCMGELDGIVNGCCGHGRVGRAYVQFWDGTVVSGEDAVTIQSILKRNKSDATLEYRLKFLKGNIPFFEEDKFEQFKSK